MDSSGVLEEITSSIINGDCLRAKQKWGGGQYSFLSKVFLSRGSHRGGRTEEKQEGRICISTKKETG